MFLKFIQTNVSKNVTASCGRSESTTFLQNTKQGLLQSTGSRGSEHTTKSGIQKTDVLSNEDFRDTSADHTTGSTGNGLLIGLIISVILVSISIGISISLALYILRSRKRKSTTKNGENTAEISEPVVTLTPSQNRPASAYATVNPGEVNDPGEEQYTEPVHNRPTSAYTTLNPGEANDPGEQQYTVPVQNHPASAYTTLNPVEANDPGEQQYTGLNIQIGSEVTKTMYSTRPNSNYTTLKLEQDRDDTENYYSGLNNI
ncbi:uncharacterized protein LOC134266758 [Saccostrea cucullata]|uniref:uncharacterized protein LOC134266758 n=1 Tax=Saccostrea cuccullata TaxID=36930 RepID=UPI002ED5C6C6